MKFAIITHVNHLKNDDYYYAYAPYVKEMNIWGKYVDEMFIVAPIGLNLPTSIEIRYTNKITFYKIPSISFINISECIKGFLRIPFICFKIFKAMKASDQIHLRCPGNIGLLGCLIQVFFPRKHKTAKYAGNWDPKAKQPLSYRFQKWILSNTYLTKNMKVLVYGDWPKQSINIHPFFTATYPKNKILGIQEKNFIAPYQFMFVGSLSSGKRPIYAVQLVEALMQAGENVKLAIYGEGSEREIIEEYITNNNLMDIVFLHGNKTSEEVETAYKKSHFLVLPSKSEGWPKAVAEGMFWGVIPIVTKISCVPWMLSNGERGILTNGILEEDLNKILSLFQDKINLKKLSVNAQQWSHQYTLDYFESEIKRILA
ncbi:glycosyltransferase [Aureisphaera sp. CAU 1614]|uniref:Glycosyltransferase n=1 Tax=Halomarinibacterium sedimenti TaxID=2857106 RepID=A0A9X1FNG7_9FLAO|nr:glycosyltransferase [Halomarinibacterium sedimenti]MBW2937702.1 glycosyltransferase [Halomarinibacterium sedimenti]